MTYVPREVLRLFGGKIHRQTLDRLIGPPVPSPLKDEYCNIVCNVSRQFIPHDRCGDNLGELNSS